MWINIILKMSVSIIIFINQHFIIFFNYFVKYIHKYFFLEDQKLTRIRRSFDIYKIKT